jgi:hypothetical protein
MRLTSKSPSELLTVLGPHGVDELIRAMMSDGWREHPAKTRTLGAVKKDVQEVFERNMKVWGAIKKPTPENFFANLLPHAADGHMRQALVLTWMMLPRTGGRDFADVKKIITQIYQRNLDAWDQDEATFSGKKRKKARRGKSVSAKPAKKPPSKRRSSRKWIMAERGPDMLERGLS